MPPLSPLPDNAHIRFDDVARLAGPDSRTVIAGGVRADGSVILANRGTWGRLVCWLRSNIAGRPDEASVVVNQVLARQLMAARGGLSAIAASERVGIDSLPLRNRDLQVVLTTIARHAPDDPAAALELRDGYVDQEAGTVGPITTLPAVDFAKGRAP